MKYYPVVKNTAIAAVFMSAIAIHPSLLLADDLPEIQKQGNITYVTGGIGDEEREALHSMRHNYNLSVLSADKYGAYPGDTHIVISDKQGTELVNTDAGPLFYARMPAGRYIVEESSGGQSKKRAVTIAE